MPHSAALVSAIFWVLILYWELLFLESSQHLVLSIFLLTKNKRRLGNRNIVGFWNGNRNNLHLPDTRLYAQPDELSLRKYPHRFKADIIALGIMSAILILYFGIFYRTILYISFDEVFARTYSSYVDVFKYITTSLIALTIVLNIRMAGVVLVISLLTIPPNIAMLFTRVYFKIVIWSVLAGFVGTATGYAISYYAGIPVGATIIFTLVILWVLVKGSIYLIEQISKFNNS
jgi:hypothetical protein